MRGKKDPRKATGGAEAGRRSFLKGVAAGVGGLVAAVALLPRAGAAKVRRGTPADQTPKPILYRRTEYVDRYFRTLS